MSPVRRCACRPPPLPVVRLRSVPLSSFPLDRFPFLTVAPATRLYVNRPSSLLFHCDYLTTTTLSTICERLQSGV